MQATVLQRLPVYGRLIRVEHTLFSLPVMLAGMLLGKPRPAIDTLGWALLALFGARTAAMTLNRWLDRDLDARNPRTRDWEIPRGQVHKKEVIALTLGGFGLYLFAAFRLSPWCGYLAPVPALVFLVYPLLKRWTWMCHFGIGLALAFSPLGGFLAVVKTPQAALAHPAYGALLGLAAFVLFWVSGFDIYYAILDEAFDRQVGVHAIPARFGRQTAERAALAVHFLGWFLLIVGLYAGRLLERGVMYGALVLAILLGIEHALARRNRIAQAFFDVNVLVGLWLAVVILWATRTAVPV